MPVVSEESPKRHRRFLWPLWVVGVLALLLAGVALLPLGNFTAEVAPVYVYCSISSDDEDPPGYSMTRNNRGDQLHSIRLGTWHWFVIIDEP